MSLSEQKTETCTELFIPYISYFCARKYMHEILSWNFEYPWGKRKKKNREKNYSYDPFLFLCGGTRTVFLSSNFEFPGEEKRNRKKNPFYCILLICVRKQFSKWHLECTCQEKTTQKTTQQKWNGTELILWNTFNSWAERCMHWILKLTFRMSNVSSIWRVLSNKVIWVLGHVQF